MMRPRRISTFSKHCSASCSATLTLADCPCRSCGINSRPGKRQLFQGNPPHLAAATLTVGRRSILMMIHNQQSQQRAVDSGEIQGDIVYEGDAFDVELLHFPDGDHVFHLRMHDRMVSLWVDSALLRELDYSVELALGGLEQAGDERVAVHFMAGDPPLWDIELTLL